MLTVLPIFRLPLSAMLPNFSASKYNWGNACVKNSGTRRIAERYVKALFEVAESLAAIDQVEADLKVLKTVIDTSSDFRQFLTNPLLSYEVRGKTMLAILTKMQAHQVTRQFFGMLIRQKRLAILPDVATLYCEWAATARGELHGELFSASPLKPKQVEMVGALLGKTYGKTMKLEVREQPDLLGGVVIKIGSLQLDSSLAGKMRRLKLALQAT
jgi:F-type H+-transporting ATPase subunit delta